MTAPFARTEDRIEDVAAAACAFHRRHRQALGFPYVPKARDLMAHPGWVQARAEDASFCFLVDAQIVPESEIPVIRDAWLDSSVVHTVALRDVLHSIGEDLLLIVESYNVAVLDAIHALGAKRTSHSQQKLICPVLPTQPADMPPGVRLRTFRPGDEELYADLYNRTLGYLGSTVDVTFVHDVVARPSFDPEGYFFAECDGEIVGITSVEVGEDIDEENSFGYIYQFGVVPDYQGRGIGHVLLSSALCFAAQRHATRVGVGVRSSNERALKVFHDRGFEDRFSSDGYRLQVP